MAHIRDRPYHPMIQGKIERYHQTIKNIIKLQNYYLPSKLEWENHSFVQYYNHERIHESLGNMTPVDGYHGRARKIKMMHNIVKKQAVLQRRKKPGVAAPEKGCYQTSCASGKCLLIF